MFINHITIDYRASNLNMEVVKSDIYIQGIYI